MYANGDAYNDLWFYSNSKYPATTCRLSVTVLFLDYVVLNIIPIQPFNQSIIYNLQNTGE